MAYETCPNCGSNLDPGEKCSCRQEVVVVDAEQTTEPPPTESAERQEIIEVTQLPVIVERLLEIKTELIARTEAALALECTEESKQVVKAARTELTKVFKELEAKRIEAKKAILAPYNDFEAVYKQCITDIYQPTDRKLAERILEIDEVVLDRKREEIAKFYDESCIAIGIDFITLDKFLGATGTSINLSLTVTKAKKAIKAFLDRVSNELGMINLEEHSVEILVEYKQSLNAAEAVTTVKNRIKAADEERVRQVATEIEERRRAEVAAAIDTTVAEQAEHETLSAPVAVAEPTEPTEPIEAEYSEIQPPTVSYTPEPLHLTIYLTEPQKKQLGVFLRETLGVRYHLYKEGNRNG